MIYRLREMAKIKKLVQKPLTPSRYITDFGLNVRFVDIYKIAFAGRIIRLVMISQRTNANKIRSEFLIVMFRARLVFHKQNRDIEFAMNPSKATGIITSAL